MADCENGIHLWTARFYRNGSLAFWFCSRCGETDRDVEHLENPLEDLSGGHVSTEPITIEGEKPLPDNRVWRLSDGSILKETEPASNVFRGYPIAGLSASNSYILRASATGEVREFVPARDRASAVEGCYILTRYCVENNKLIKYRIHCSEDQYSGEIRIDEPVGISILSDLTPVQ